MRIGFLSGDLYEWSSNRGTVSVPDYTVQGHLIRNLMMRGHEAVLLTRAAVDGDYLRLYAGNGYGVDYRPGADPNLYDLDMLFVDRLGRDGSEYEVAMRQVSLWRGPVAYHSYIAAPGWNPPFQSRSRELLGNKRWLILNRADDPPFAHAVMCGKEEQVIPKTVEFAKWEPFLMAEHPFAGSVNKPSGMREYRQGYYGRLPRSERRRSRQVESFMLDRGWSRVIYGPKESTRWLSEATGCHDGGRIPYCHLPDYLNTFDLTVQVPIDRFANKGAIGYRTHRLIECALAGVLQLADPALGIRELEPWVVRGEESMRRWEGLSLSDFQQEVRKQQVLLLPRADPDHVMFRLENMLKSHA